MLTRQEGKTTAGKHRPGSGQERKENERQSGDRLIAELLGKNSWSEEKLRAERKGHPVKVALARELRAKTTLT